MRVTIVRLRRPPKDKYGDPATSEPERLEIRGVTLAPRVGGPGTSSSEIHDRGRSGVVAGLTAYPPAHIDFRASDQVEILHPQFEGQIFEVEGEPGIWESPYSTDRPGQELALRRAQG